MLEGTKSVKRIWFGLAIVLTLLGFAIFGTYWHFLPRISDDHAAWSSFGSLLSGFFTLGGVIATIATLLFLNAQNQSHQRFIEWQIKTLTFDQYINHRRLFIERLVELQNSHNNIFRFPNTEAAYNAIFPHNNPTNVDTKVSPAYDEDAKNLLGHLDILFGQLSTLLSLADWKTQDITSLISTLSTIAYEMNMEWVAETIDGDIIHDDENIGVNIYFLGEGIKRLVSVYNSYLFFTGNPAFTGADRDIGGHKRDAVMRHFLEHRFNNGIHIFKEAPGLVEFEELYLDLESARNLEGKRLMPGTRRWLDVIFSNRDSFNSFREGLIQGTVLGSGMHECNKVLEELEADDPNCAYLRDLNMRLLNLAQDLG